MTSEIVQQQGYVEASGSMSPIQMAKLGLRARSAGMQEADVVALIALVQEVAEQAAREAAQKTTMAVVPALLEFVEGVHQGTAEKIAARIHRLPKGFFSDHQSCIHAAYAVAAEPASRLTDR